MHYVRNHGYVPQLDWHTHTLTLSGIGISTPIELSMDDLLQMPSRTLPVMLVCAGNRRKEQNMVKQSLGFSWGAAAVSTAVWTGVPLWALLKKCGIDFESVEDCNVHVAFEGSETLPKGKYGTSLPLVKAMDRPSDVLLAYKMNGEFLPPDHGFPLRLIIPGYIGGRMVKWLKNIDIRSHESDNHFHYFDNRVLPTTVQDAETANSGKWWFKPEYIINELNVNSVITKPSHGECIDTNNDKLFYTFKGYAYAGGGRKVIRVELSFDDGATWKLCEIHPSSKTLLPTKYGKYWCWSFWSYQVSLSIVADLSMVAVRAWDASMNTQPDNITWVREMSFFFLNKIYIIL